MAKGVAGGLYFENGLDITDVWDDTPLGSQTRALVSEYKANGTDMSTSSLGYVFRNTSLSCDAATRGSLYQLSGSGLNLTFAQNNSCLGATIPPPVGGTLPN